MPEPTWESRAVERPVPSGMWSECPHCTEWVSWKSPQMGVNRQVVANVYDGRGVWLRVEHWHSDCYTAAAEPYGSAAADDEAKHVRER